MGMHSSQANKGQEFEHLIVVACKQYQAKGIAVIHKIPTAFKPIRNGRGQVVSCKVEEKAVCDFLGRYKGFPVAFEAKHTWGDHIRWAEVQDHQEEFLDAFQGKSEGICFVLAGFEMKRFFLIPWAVWKEQKALWKKHPRTKGFASFTPDGIHPHWEITGAQMVALDFLKKVDDVWSL